MATLNAPKSDLLLTYFFHAHSYFILIPLRSILILEIFLLMLPFSILIHNTNALSSPQANNISLTDFFQANSPYPVQSSFHRHARIPSLLSNLFFWLAFAFAIGVLQIGKYELSTTARILYGLMMLVIIIICYVFILFESKGCVEQVLLKKRIQIDMIKRELGLIQKNPKLNNYLTVTATNYYDSVRRKYIDYQLYDSSICIRLQSYFYRNIRLIETPFNIRQYHINIPDFSIAKNRLCQLLFKFNVSIIGRDARIVQDDIEQEFKRLELKLSNSNSNNKELDSISKLARIQRHIYFQLNDLKQQELLFGQRRTCLVYENRIKTYNRWFLTENSFWIMTCIGLSWVFRAIFACLITKIIVPVHIELEGAMPLQSAMISEDNNSIERKISDKN